MQKLIIPKIKQLNQDGYRIIAIEGCNGVGKSTLISKLKDNYPNIEFRLCVPDIFQTSKEMKKFMLFESSTLCSAIYYLSGAIESKQMYNNQNKNIIFDRSIWSTFAATYSKNPSLINILFSCLEILKEYIYIPSKVIVLEASYEVCKKRINQKPERDKYDKDSEKIFERKSEFYHLLKKSGYDIEFIDTSTLSIIDVYNASCEILNKYYM